MFTQIQRAVAAGALVAAVAMAGSAGVKKAASAGPIPGEDEHRSTSGFTVSLMEHAKAVNRLARAKGQFNSDLAREHAAEATRSAGGVSRHLRGYLGALDSRMSGTVVAESAAAEASDAAIQRLSAALADTLKAAAPDRLAVSAAATDLYLAAKDLSVAQRAAGKSLGIRAATPPRKAAPRKPKADKEAVAKGTT